MGVRMRLRLAVQLARGRRHEVRREFVGVVGVRRRLPGVGLGGGKFARRGSHELGCEFVRVLWGRRGEGLVLWGV